MISLSEFAKNYVMRDFKHEYECECYYNSMKDYFGEDLSKEIIESAHNRVYKDFILESLTSHDIDLLIKKIFNEFSKNYHIEFEYSNGKKQALTLFIYNNNDFYRNLKFKSMLEVFGYYISRYYVENDICIIDICPRYAKDVYKMVYQEHYGKLYHFTTGEYVKEIERTGLRCKTSSYKNFPERIYLYSSHKSLNKISNIDKFIKKVTNDFNRKHYGLCVYKIDLNKLNTNTIINFYTDDQMNDSEAVYTYNNIPSECITKINYELK